MTFNHKYYYVYLLKCSDSSFYTGITNNIARRLIEHESGINPGCYTYSRRPVELVYGEYFTDPRQAISFEKKVKGWTRAKKEALIKNDWDKIRLLAQCQNASHSGNHRNEEQTE